MTWNDSRGSRALAWGTAVALLFAGLAPLAAGAPDQSTVGSFPVLLQEEKLVRENAQEPSKYGDARALTSFGSSVDIDGEIAVSGTAYDHQDPTDNVHMFEQTESGWKPTANIADPDEALNNGFGESVAVDAASGVLAVGDPGYDHPNEEDAGALYIFEWTSNADWTLTNRFVGPVNGDGNDHHLGLNHGPGLGDSVSVDGETIVVGVSDAQHSGRSSGEIQIYQRTESGWERTARFTGDAPGDHLGSSVDVEGSTVIAGSMACTRVGCGAVHVYDRVGGEWTAGPQLLPPEPMMGQSDSMGWPVDLSEDEGTIVTGAVWNDEVHDVNLDPFMETANPGSAFVFRENDKGIWRLDASLSNPTPQVQDRFGQSVAVSPTGTQIFVSASHHPGPVVRAGTVHSFVQQHDKWLHTGRIQGEDTGFDDYFGEQIALSDGTLLVGAPFDDDRRDGTPAPVDDVGDVGWNQGTDAGSAYIFTGLEATSLQDESGPTG